MAKTLLPEPEHLQEEVEEQKPKKFKSRRGAKLLITKKPQGAARSLVDTERKSDKPVTVYKQYVTDADSGETNLYIWWHQEDSKTVGKEEIVKYNQKTEEELTIGYDYTIPYTKESRKMILDKATRGTVFVDKTSGRDSFAIRNPQTDF